MMRTVIGVLLLGVTLLMPRVATAQSEQVYYYHLDAIGSVRAITDASNQVVERHDYLPFGEPRPLEPAGQDPRRFSGKERDSDTGFDYSVARYYANNTGRFTTVDPNHVGGDPSDPQSWNAYAFARNNPLRFVDPFGLDSCPASTDTSTCVEGRAGTNQFTIDYTFWLYAALAEQWWAAMHDQSRPTRAEFPLLPGFLAPAESVGIGAMRRLTFEEAVSATRHAPGAARLGSAAGPINGQNALDTSVTIGSNTTRRVGIDYANSEFVVFDEHAPGLFHGHVRGWSELTPSMQAALRKAGMVSGRGNILHGDILLKP